jgi:hypothetical protein
MNNGTNRSFKPLHINTGDGDNLTLSTNSGAGVVSVKDASSVEKIKIDGSTSKIVLANSSSLLFGSGAGDNLGNVADFTSTTGYAESRMFRSTNTTGESRFRIFKGNGTSEYLIELNGTTGGISASNYKVGVLNGVSGSFTSNDGKTITVTSGIITGIV